MGKLFKKIASFFGPKGLKEEKRDNEIERDKRIKNGVLLATGIDSMDKAMSEKLQGVQVVGVSSYRESLIKTTEKKNPKIIITSQLLEGGMTEREMILTLRTKFPDTRIIYILKERNEKEMLFLYEWFVFDVLYESFTIQELQQLVDCPKQFRDVVEEMKKMEYKRPPSWDSLGS